MDLRFWNVSVFGAVGMVRTLRLGEGSYVVGSDPDCDIAALGDGLAPRHAQLVLSGEAVLVEDLGTAAGTLLGGNRVEGRQEGDCPATLELGQVRLVVEYAGAWADSGASPEQTLRLVHPAYGRGHAQAYSADSTQRLVPQGGYLERAPVSADGPGGETLAFGMPRMEMHVGASVPVHMDYALRGEIARGGMGRIYAAEDPNLERQVALKVSSLSEAGAEAQFCHEARVLALLAHPNIVPVYNLGKDGEGRPFYSMKLVQGRTLREVLRQIAEGEQETVAYFSQARLLRVFRKVCDAVAFAHDRGFLHRDLKPENVMVGEFGEVLVMDWGLAKALPKEGAPLDEGAHPGCIEGTPQYMSPEQAEGEYANLDERSDIYSLGGILFSILTLRPPVEGRTLDEVLSKVKNGETTTMLLNRADARGLRTGVPVKMRAGVPDALRAVTQKAMSREKHLRYGTVQELARDLESYQNGFATSAEDASLARLGLLFVKRHRMASLLLAVLFVGAGVFTVRLARSEKRQKESASDALRQAAIASANALRAEENAGRADEQARKAAASERVAREEREEARIATASAHIAGAEAAEQLLNSEAMRRALEGVPADLRDQQWRYLDRVRDASVRTLESPAVAYPVAFFPHPTDPDVLLTLNQDKWVRALTLSSGESRELLKVDFTEPSLAVSSDGKRIAVMRRLPTGADGSYPASIDVWDVVGGNKRLQIPFLRDPHLSLIKFSPDGLSLLLQTPVWGSLSMFDSSTGALRWNMKTPSGLSADFLRSPGLVGVHFTGAWVMQFNTLTGIPRNEAVKAVGAKGFAYSRGERLCADPDWKSLTFISRDVCRKVETGQGKIDFEIRLPLGAVKGACVVSLPARKMIATLSAVSDSSAVLQVWSDADGALVRTFPLEIQQSVGPDWSLLFQPGAGAHPDRLLVIRGRQIKVFSLPEGLPETTLGPLESALGGHFTFLDEPWKVLLQARRIAGADKALVASCDILDLRRKDRIGVFPHEKVENPYFFPSTSQDGKRVACWRLREPEVKIFKVVGNALKDPVSFPVSKNPGAFQLSPDGSRFWAETVVYSASTGAILSKIDVKGLAVINDYSPARWVGNGHMVKIMMREDGSTGTETAAKTRSLVLWNVENGARNHSTDAPDARALAVSPDGAQIAEGGSDMKVRIRDAQTLEVSQVLRVHDGPVLDLAWHPKLPLLATCSEDFFVRIWNLQTGELVQEFGVFSSLPVRLSWSPDGSRLSVQLATGEVGLFTPKLPKP
jgi:serine/threonine protein kinase/WD40 repeat protein